MSALSFTNWDELWSYARAENFTHWNFSRGKTRFRPVMADPEEIGEDPLIIEDEIIKIRFYRIVGEEYVAGEVDVTFRVPASSSDFPEEFDEWETAKQRTFIETQLQRISAGRFSKQMASADRLLYRFIDHLCEEIRQHKITNRELTAKNLELLATRGIGNVWEFLVHPNAEKVIEAMSRAINNKPDNVSIADELRKLAESPDTRKLFADPSGKK